MRAVTARVNRLSYGLRVLVGAVLLAGLPAAAAPATTTTLVVTAGGSPVTMVASRTVVALTATVLAGGAPVTPGQVNFCDAAAAYCTDIHLLGSAQLTNAGTAAIKFIPGIANHSYKAVFVGTTRYASSASGASPLAVTGTGLTTTAIASSGNAGNYTLTGILTALGAPAPTGLVSFENQTNGNAMAATAVLDGTTLVNTFAPIQNYGTDNNPYGVAVADLNGDGIPDLAVVNNGDHSVSVLLGHGDGTFASAVNYSTGIGPEALAVGDFNSDGVPDLVVANNRDNSLSILLGNGDGTFAVQPAIAAGGGPSAVAVGDFNNDGILDLAVANDSAGPGSVSILLGNGNGTFQPGVSYPVGDAPHGLAVADFNGDGALDLVVANSGSDNVSVLLGNGDGTFQSQSIYPVASGGSNAWSVADGDFNGDGSPDIAIASSGNVSVLLNKGNGTFNPAVGYAAGNTAYALAVGDFNVDGNADLAVANVNSLNLSVLLGNGDGTFGSPSNAAAGGIPQAIAVGDFNGDGRPDLVAAVTGSADYAGVLLGEQTETATAAGVSIAGSGMQGVLASYSGDANHDSSFSSTIALTGSPITPTISWSPTPGILYGATLSGILDASALNGTSPVPGSFAYTATPYGGSASPVTSATVLVVGSYTLTATFTPTDTIHYTSVSASISFTVNKASPTASVVSSLNPVLLTNPVTFTATVSSTASTPTGTISFYDGTTLLASSLALAQGTATYTTSSLTLGTHSIMAIYSGDANFTGVTSAALAQTVEDFILSFSTPPAGTPVLPVYPGGTATFVLQVEPSSGLNFPSAVTFTLSGLPAGATATFTPKSLPAGSAGTNVNLVIQLANQIFAHNSPHPLGRGLALAMVGGMLLLPFGTKLRRSAGRAGRLAALLLLMLAATGAAVGLTACGGGGYFGQQVRNYTLTITATSGALSHTTTAILTVQ
jgi:hypothetical protein